MYLSKSMQATRNPNSLFQFSRMGFAVKEYDVAVIGGGPGGELDNQSVTSVTRLYHMTIC